MKKIITFSNFMVLLGIMTILFYLIPAVNVFVDATYKTSVNLFTATFGGAFTISFGAFASQTYSLLPCGGLITAFILGIVAILLTFLKCKSKYATIAAFPFYVASGVLVACTASLVKSVNFDVVSSNLNYGILGGAITVATFWCILAFFALVDFIATIAKPKQQPVAY